MLIWFGLLYIMALIWSDISLPKKNIDRIFTFVKTNIQYLDPLDKMSMYKLMRHCGKLGTNVHLEVVHEVIGHHTEVDAAWMAWISREGSQLSPRKPFSLNQFFVASLPGGTAPEAEIFIQT